MKPKHDTVISAINNACNSLTAQGQPLTKASVWKLASMIVGVSQAMEAGKIYEEPKAPSTVPPPAPAPVAPPPAAPEHEDVPYGDGPPF